MIWAILIPIAVCLIISYLSTSILYKIVFLALGGFITLTVGLNYINNLISNSIKKAKELNMSITKNNDFERRDIKDFKRIVVGNEDYTKLVDLLKCSMKNKELNREQILDFKDQVNTRLGSKTNHYYTFKFNNDLHEIYCKIKNKALTSKDYQELLQILNGYKPS